MTTRRANGTQKTKLSLQVQTRTASLRASVSVPMGPMTFKLNSKKLVALKESLEKMLTLEKSPKEGLPQATSPSTAAHQRGSAAGIPSWRPGRRQTLPPLFRDLSMSLTTKKMCWMHW